MSIVSACPKCREQVTIPEGLEAKSQVRCPLCDEEYPLGEAMAEAPPALIPVRPEGLNPDSDALLKGQLVTQPFHVTEGEGLLGTPEAEDEASPEGADLDVWQKVDATPTIDTGEPAEDSPAVGTSELAGYDFEKPEEAYEPVDGSPEKKPKKKRKRKSAARHMVEVFVGGFGGLLLGYYLLLWVGPARVRNGMPKLPLPYLPHTMDQAPADEAQQPAGNTAGVQKSQQRKTGPKPSGNTTTIDPASVPIAPPVVEPQPEPEPEPEPEPLPPDYAGPRRPPVFGSDELGSALKEANLSIHGPDKVVEMNDQVYARFSRLGHVLAFVEDRPTDSRLASRRDAAEDLLEDLVQESVSINQVGNLAGALLEAEDADNSGILLAGKVQAVGFKDGLYGATVKLPGAHGSVVVMSRKKFSFAKGDEVFLLGSVVNSRDFVGYGGSQDRIVWAATAVNLPPE